MGNLAITATSNIPSRPIALAPDPDIRFEGPASEVADAAQDRRADRRQDRRTDRRQDRREDRRDDVAERSLPRRTADDALAWRLGSGADREQRVEQREARVQQARRRLGELRGALAPHRPPTGDGAVEAFLSRVDR